MILSQVYLLFATFESTDTGFPKPEVMRAAARKITPFIDVLDGTKYYQKNRNIDTNGIYPMDITSFLKQFLTAVIDGVISAPEYVIGCACGSSEIVMPLAGSLEVELGFIRRSWRREDDAPKVLEEDNIIFQESLRNHVIVCVEDYVCTGRSLQKVTEKAKDYGAKIAYGTSMNNSQESSLRADIKREKFNVFWKDGI